MKLSLGDRQALLEMLRRYLKAGITPQEALRAIAEEGGRLAGPVRMAEEAVGQGYGMARSLRVAGCLAGELEEAVMEAGEEGGRLEEVCGDLAGWMAVQLTMRREMGRQLVYPLFLLHFAILVGALPQALIGGGGLEGYLRGVGVALIWVYGVGAGLIGGMVLAWEAGGRVVWVDRIWRCLPVVRRIWREGAWSRFCGAMAAQLRAGIHPGEALIRAGAAARVAGVRRAVGVAERVIREGGGLAEGLGKRAGAWSGSLVRAVGVGERTGDLEAVFGRWAVVYRETEESGWRRLGEWLPRMIYLGVAIFVGWTVIGMASEGVRMLDQMLEGM